MRVAPSSPLRRTPRSENAAAPMATSTVVRSPAERWRHCRSAPMSVPNRKATPSSITVQRNGGRLFMKRSDKNSGRGIAETGAGHTLAVAPNMPPFGCMISPEVPLAFPITHRAVTSIALPMMFAYLSTALVGVVSTAAIGHLGVADLSAGIAIAAILFDVLLVSL